MEPKTHDLLIAAWREKRLAAVHIDLQKMYAKGNTRTFLAVGNFAAMLRQWNIPNIWVTFPQLKVKRRINPGITTVQHFQKDVHDPDHHIGSAISARVRAHDNEIVVVKNWGSAFHTSATHLHDTLEERKVDTVIVDGVHASACVARTLDDGTKSNKYDFIVVEDCINILKGTNYKEFLGKSRLKDPSAFQRRFHKAATKDIFKALEAQKPEQITMPPEKACLILDAKAPPPLVKSRLIA